MGKWEIMGRSYHDDEYDLLTVRVRYGTRLIENDYLIRKDEKRVPKHLMEERKRGASRPIDGKRWVEGTIKRKGSVRVTPTARYKSNKTERV